MTNTKMLSVHGLYPGDRTESRSYFYDSQCVGMSYSTGGKHYYKSTRHPETTAHDTLDDVMREAKRLAAS